jgi:hypothetical protein
MEDIDTRSAELDARLAKVRRAQRMHRVYMLIVFALGIAAGFALAEAIIDPIVVITDCGGVRA